MVLVKLCKFIQLLKLIQSWPLCLPKRKDKLFDAYIEFQASSENVISVAVSSSLERMHEKLLDDEDVVTQKKILIEFDRLYSGKKFNFSEDSTHIHLITNLDSCNVCGGELIITRPNQRRGVNLYTVNGGVKAEIYVKHCERCNASVYPSYSDYLKSGILYRKYVPPHAMKYFSVTSETFFDISLLKCISEDLFTCHSRFQWIVDKYNRLHPTVPMIINRIVDAFLIYAVTLRLEEIEFPVMRDRFRNIDIEKCCKYIYSSLRIHIDDKWLHHECSNCVNKVCVMDGAAKVYRTVCAAKPEKLTSYGDLNQFICCTNSPITGKSFCEAHEDDKICEPESRLDHGIMTRAKRKELGIDLDCLSSMVGCRKTDNVNKRYVSKYVVGSYECCVQFHSGLSMCLYLVIYLFIFLGPNEVKLLVCFMLFVLVGFL